MRSCDTNILFYAFHSGCRENGAARDYLGRVAKDADFLICELVLIELYVLLRNPKLIDRPLTPPEAAGYCQSPAAQPEVGHHRLSGRLDGSGLAHVRRTWVRLPGKSSTHDSLWPCSITGVVEFATRNTAHFEPYGFDLLLNPIDGS